MHVYLYMNKMPPVLFIPNSRPESMSAYFGINYNDLTWQCHWNDGEDWGKYSKIKIG